MSNSWLRRLRTTGTVLASDPALIVRLPRFLWRACKEGPRASVARLQQITHPERFSFSYEAWIAQYSTPTSVELLAMRNWASQLSNPVHISILMPVYNPNPEWLQAAIDSVRAQAYPYWELCIADDQSNDPAVHHLLEIAAATDERIRVVFRPENGHISACSNSALSVAQSPWIALLDHDDLLPVDALIWVAQAIIKNPHARVFYSDEDKLSIDGRRFGPYFKSDWNPVLMEAQNMISHLGVYFTELVRDVGGFREGFEGSQDYDLAWRCIETLNRTQIVHIPRVLYHWRVHDESTASSSKAKPYAQRAMENALEQHCLRIGLPIACLHVLPQGQRVQLTLPDPLPAVSIIIPTRNGYQFLQPCLDSLLNRTAYPSFEVLVIDNGSDDLRTLEYLQRLHSQAKIRVLRDDRPFNFSALNNLAVSQTSSRLICLLNNDIEVINPDWLDEMVSHFQRPGVGAVGAKLLFPNRTIQHAGVVLGMGGVAAHGHRGLDGGARGYFGRANLAQEVSAVTAACLLVSRDAWVSVNGMDADCLSVAYNDVDFCLRIRDAGYQIIYTPFSTLLHHESVSRGDDRTMEQRYRFEQEMTTMHERWGDSLQQDPYFNPNLSLTSSNYQLAWPPRLKRWPTDAV